ncbi:MAG: MoxR family ATPase [Methylacidiphilales bacterium]|nr:MoxR family ATPase [Candidatus Methylacidiphilales bacterium]
MTIEISLLIKKAISSIQESMYVSTDTITLCIAAICARGHILIEDTPGVGKTTLAKIISSTFSLETKRVQCTNDLLPSDVLGYYTLNNTNQTLTFKKGPVFTNILLVDEINRASPRTQSALLEVMEERCVTIDGTTSKIPEPFIVLATQNPSEHSGTFQLPQSQLDRFICRLSLGYPDAQNELGILKGVFNSNIIPHALIDSTILNKIYDATQKICMSDSVLQYLIELITATRKSKELITGISPRGALQIKLMAQAIALIQGRNFVLPDDIHTVFVPCCEHKTKCAVPDKSTISVLQTILSTTPLP